MKTGMSYTACSKAIGITYETWRNWSALGREGKEPYAKFWIEVQLAESELMKNLLQQVKKQADLGNLNAITWLLERRFSEFSKQSTQNVKTTSENVSLNYEAKSDKKSADEIRQEILAKLRPKCTIPYPEE